MTIVHDTTRRSPATAKAKEGLSRRETLKIVAAAAAVPLGIGVFRDLAPEPRFHTWNGMVLGGDSSLSLWHPDL
jgi:thiamine biosynthesis lipoprotein